MSLSFSYSKLGLYKECPQKYKFRYILKLPEKPKYYFAFGSALHKVMEYIYSKPLFPPTQDALRFFKSDWQSTSFQAKGYASAQKEKEGFEEGERIIKSYCDKHSLDGILPLANEFKTFTEIDGLSVISIVDRIDYNDDGKITILDYKTGKTVKREPDQLMMYQKLMSASPKLLELVKTKNPFAKEVIIDKILFYHLPTLQEQAFEPAPEEEMNGFWRSVLEVAQDIMAEKFEPAPQESKCRWCDYREMCPVFKSSGKENASAFAGEGAGIDPLESLSAKIDECGALKEKIENLEKEIADTMQKNDYNVHYGKNFMAEIAKTELFDFSDRQKVVAILREENALKYALTPTLGSIKELLAGDKLTAEQKNRLNALVKKTEIIKLDFKKMKL